MKKRLTTIIKLLISLALMAFLFWKFDVNWGKITSQIVAPWFIIVDLFVPIIFCQFFSINRWKVFLAMQGIEESYWTLLKINLISLFQGVALPSAQGFDVFRMYHIEKLHPDKKGQASGTVIVERIIGLILLIAFACVCLPFVVSKVENAQKSIRVLLILIVCISAGLFFIQSKIIYRLYAEKHFKNKRLEAILDYIRKLHAALMNFPYRKVLLPSIPFIAGFQFFTIFSVYLLFKAFGCDVSLVDNMAMYPIISILSIVPVTIGGFGVRESFFVYFYKELGVDPEIAIAVSIMNYLVLCVFPALIGGVLWIIDIYKSQRSKSTEN